MGGVLESAYAEPVVVVVDTGLARGLQAVTDRRDRVYSEWTGRIGRRDEEQRNAEDEHEGRRARTEDEQHALCRGAGGQGLEESK